MKRTLLIFAVIAAIAFPAVALAQTSALDDESVLLALDRDIEIGADEVVGTLVVVSGQATVLGQARTVVVVDGSLLLEGTVEENVVAVDSDVDLGASAVIREDLVIPSGTVTRDPGAVVEGSVREDFDFRLGWVFTLFSILAWIAITVCLMVAGLILAAIARRQLRGAANLLSERPGAAIAATVILAIGLPLVAAFSIILLVGIPLGLGLLFLVLPSLWFAGYIVAGERVGRALLEAGRNGGRASSYLAVVVGLLILQVVAVVPFLGGLVVLLAATYGAGGLALFAWNSWRGASTSAA
ncbi:MAG: hypothetical protein R3C39_01575 [Dehalococcoidia bacterium]